MKNTKFISIVVIFNCLLNSCAFDSKIYSNNQQSIKKEQAIIENLPNGNYRFCSDPNPYPYEDKIDVHRYCFTFTKLDKKVVGDYLYRAPKDTPYICIEGKVEDNLVTGVGYENIGPNSQPYTEESFSDLKNLSANKQLNYWDNIEHYQGGLNLKVGNPSLQKLSSSNSNEYEAYWASIRYEKIKLDLNNFQQIRLENAVRFERCSN